MWFATPLALIMLVPWAILAWWLRRGRGEPMAVPFVHLWPRDGTALARRRHHPPPAAIWLAMLGLLLLLLAAAQPQLAWKARPRLAVILDRGATMSAQVAGQTRLVHFLDENRDLLGSLEARLDLQFIPAAGENGASPSSSVVERARAAGPTAADTLAALNEAARRAVKQNEAVLIITDRELDLGDGARLLQIGPRQPIRNAAIVDASLGDGGLLVSFTGTTAGVPAGLTVEAGDERFQQEPASPASQGIAEALVPLPALLVDSLKIELSAEPDAWPGDNVRFIARERAWPDIRPAEDIPPEIRRVASLFTELRPPRPHSRVITIGLDPSASAIVAPVGRPASGEWQVAAHDLTAGVDWPGLAGVRVAA